MAAVPPSPAAAKSSRLEKSMIACNVFIENPKLNFAINFNSIKIADSK
jgi:hypothetical protein